MNNRYNKIFERYVKNIKEHRYEDIGDLWYGEVTKEDFTKFAYHKIDYLIECLFDGVEKTVKDKQKTYTICAYMRKMLKDNLYNNNCVVFDFFNELFQVTENPDDHGQIISFDCYYGATLGEAEYYTWGDVYCRSLIIEICFDPLQCGDAGVYQIRCQYGEVDSECNCDFEMYTNDTNIEDYLALNEEDIDSYYKDWFEMQIIDLSYFHELNEELGTKEAVDEMKNRVAEMLEKEK